MTTFSIISKTPLSEAFFSSQNTNRIQDEIRYYTWLRSEKQFVIGRQDDAQLELVMRSIYLQHGKNLDYNILGQVKILNQHVVDYCVEKIIVQIKQRNAYLRDVETGPIPLEHSINESREPKTLENKKIGFVDDEIPIGSLLQSDGFISH